MKKKNYKYSFISEWGVVAFIILSITCAAQMLARSLKVSVCVLKEKETNETC